MITTKVAINVNLATAIIKDNQAIHVTQMEHALVKLDILEVNVSPA